MAPNNHRIYIPVDNWSSAHSDFRWQNDVAHYRGSIQSYGHLVQPKICIILLWFRRTTHMVFPILLWFPNSSLLLSTAISKHTCSVVHHTWEACKPSSSKPWLKNVLSGLPHTTTSQLQAYWNKRISQSKMYRQSKSQGYKMSGMPKLCIV